MLMKVMETSAKQLLMAGITTAVDLGAPLQRASAIRDRINKGEVVGTRVFVSGPWIAHLSRRPPATRCRSASAASTSSTPAEAAQRNRTAGGRRRRSHQGARRPDVRGLQGDRRRRAHGIGIKVHAHVYAEAGRAERARGRRRRPPARRLRGHGAAVQPELIRDIVNAGRPVVVTAAHRAGSIPTPRRFPERLQDPELKKLFPAGHLRRGAGLAEELAGARVFSADRPRDAVSASAA